MPVVSSWRARALVLIAFTILGAGVADAQAVLPSGGAVVAG